MAGLQRSAQTFRRSGSSGLVWDERFLTEGAEDGGGGARGTGRRQPELRHSRSVGSVLRRGEEGAGHDDKKRKLVLAKPKQKDHHHQQQQQQEVVPAGGTAFRTRDVAPAAEPPSPRLPAGCCAPCAIFRAPPRRWRA
ncbi:MAPK kinase substrate protein At1g80180-like [Panicum hallii]|jgi:hypothetical protein|uniref:MAPK kinase substrate protein At1g80180-like n=1 Tax=Panicum hallii TaxID=206008 RepID=UPI000DF4D078|nr:MAPK kinase substrate protein At1g80180-like [Panicum hallii]